MAVVKFRLNADEILTMIAVMAGLRPETYTSDGTRALIYKCRTVQAGETIRLVVSDE